MTTVSTASSTPHLATTSYPSTPTWKAWRLISSPRTTHTSIRWASKGWAKSAWRELPRRLPTPSITLPACVSGSCPSPSKSCSNERGQQDSQRTAPASQRDFRLSRLHSVQGVLEHVQGMVQRVIFDDERRLDADDVAELAPDADQHPSFASQASHHRGLCVGWFLGDAISDQFDADHQPQAAHLAKERHGFAQAAQPRHDVLAFARRFLGQPL